jgi:SAM-dependent methyltransferase
MESSRAEQLYKDFWTGTSSKTRQAYYHRLYAHLRSKIYIAQHAKVLDVAGGTGELLQYFDIHSADIIDISSSGFEEARKHGYNPIQADVEKRFPIEPSYYDAAFCFEVLEHLYRPNKTLAEIHNVLKEDGVFYIGQPNMRADGLVHVRRYYPRELLQDLEKTGFEVEWVDYSPAYSDRPGILDDIRNNKSWIRKGIQCLNLLLSSLPWAMRYRMAHLWPDRFALLVIVKARKKKIQNLTSDQSPVHFRT